MDGPGSNQDFFIAKYDVNGTIQWVEFGGGLEPDDARRVYIEEHATIYFTGGFRGSASFRECNLQSSGNADVFLNKYAP